MIRNFLRWLHQPPRSTAVTMLYWLLIPYLICEAFYFWTLLNFNVVEPTILKARDLIFLAAAAYYGLLRAMLYHPVWHNEYRQWLAQTPWRADKPLPFGPAHLVLFDFTFVGLLYAMLHDSQLRDRIWVAFLVPYMIVVAITITSIGPRYIAYSIAFGLGFVPMLWPDRLAMTIAALVLVPLSYIGVQISLRSAPTGQDSRFQPKLAHAGPFVPGQSPKSLGWPYDALLPIAPPASISRQHSILSSLLLGWFVFVCLQTKIPQAQGLAMVLYTGICAFAVGGRLLIYATGYNAPISIFGRIATRRFILPRYDQIFVVPLLASVIALGSPSLMMVVGDPMSLYLPIAAAIVVFLCTYSRPTRHDWSLTGGHRINPRLNEAMFEEI